MRYEAEIQLNPLLNDGLDKKQKEEIVLSCPTQVFSMNPLNGQVDIEDADKCMYCKECVKKAESIVSDEDLIKINQRTDRVIFEVEVRAAPTPRF
jgi:NAD-dependent dihydropyrimidine dehydrogenase PreA subunit